MRTIKRRHMPNGNGVLFQLLPMLKVWLIADSVTNDNLTFSVHDNQDGSTN